MPERSQALPSQAQHQCEGCATRSHCIFGKTDVWRALGDIEPLIVKRSFEPGERLSKQDVVQAKVRLVKLGTVMRVRQGEDGNERPLEIVGPGAAFGLFAIFGQPSQTSAVCLSAGRVCECPAEVFRALIKTDPRISTEILTFTARAWGRVAAWSEGMRMRGATNQLAYALVLMRDAHGQHAIMLPTHTILAKLLGTTRETIVRGLSMLEQEGLLKRSERRVVEVKRDAILEWLGAARTAASTETPMQQQFA